MIVMDIVEQIFRWSDIIIKTFSQMAFWFTKPLITFPEATVERALTLVGVDMATAEVLVTDAEVFSFLDIIMGPGLIFVLLLLLIKLILDAVPLL